MAPAIIANDGNGVYDNKADGKTPVKSAVLHRSLHIEPYRVVGSKGNYLHLDNGQKIFDATTGAAVACLGHGNERVKAAVARQMDELCYCHSMFFSTPAMEGLADELIAGTEAKMARAFLVSSGKQFKPVLILGSCHSRLRSHGKCDEARQTVLPRVLAAAARKNKVHCQEGILSRHYFRFFVHERPRLA